MGIKDLFELEGSAKVLAAKSLNDAGTEIESGDYIIEFDKERSRFIPQVDFGDPANFVSFGSAEKYYEDAFTRIINFYPYDGSKKEKLQWHLSSSHIDNYIFDHVYPRTNGYALLSADGWGSRTDSITVSGHQFYYGATATASYEYIQFKGGPHKDADNAKLVDMHPDVGGTANLYDSSSFRESNLELNVSASGVTVEFWLKKDAFDIGKTSREVVLDLWNGVASSSAEYGRLTIEVSGTTDLESPWYVTFQSGTYGFFNQQVGTGIPGTGSLATWKHYAFTFLSSSGGITTKFYTTGALNQSTELGGGGSGIEHVTGSLIANIGALRTAPSGNAYDGYTMEGWGKLSASIDEFRFWKTQRNSKEIGQNWFSQVAGGTNTDDSNTKLGVYYKFNEGITESGSSDSIVLDYSGRITNGSWTGYDTYSRSTGSAMILGNAATIEFKDPIIRENHPLVNTIRQAKIDEGKLYDHRNNAGIYKSIPSWISSEDERGQLLNLTQIMSSYFDTLNLQIQSLNKLKNVSYLSGSVSGSSGSYDKPIPFADKLVTSMGFVAPEIFADATVLEKFANRDDYREFESELFDIKNIIYKNIYNNLVQIYKTKGTEKSFRNLVRCFGIDDELIKINFYSNELTFRFEDTVRATTVRKNYVDFNHSDRFNATVHQQTASSAQEAFSSNTLSYVYNSEATGSEVGSALTVQCEVVFPDKLDESHPEFFNTMFLTASLFGAHRPDSGSAGLHWKTSDFSNFQLYAIRKDYEDRDVYFYLTGTAGGVIPEISSSIYPDVYRGNKWNLALRVYPSSYGHVGRVSGSGDRDYTVSLYGINTLLGEIQHEFETTSSLTYDQGLDFIKHAKRYYVGAHRQDFTGSVLQQTDIRASNFRVWLDLLPNEVLRLHAKDPMNYGTLNPSRSPYLFEGKLSGSDFKEIETLALNWDFDTLTGSDANGTFLVKDFSSGSYQLPQGGTWVHTALKNRYPGVGFDFQVNNTGAFNREYMHAYRQQLPEVLNSDDTVNILTTDDDVFTREHRPVKNFISIEKSMYQEISHDILNLFGTIKDFNNLVGEPVNRYRPNYKSMEKLRQFFFNRVQNTPDVEKFVDFYKWFDDSLTVMLMQLVPASANMSKDLRTMIESHILERAKYQSKFPTLEMKVREPEGRIFAINELLYNWKTGHAPISNNEADNCFWWNERAERDHPTFIVSGSSEVVDQRNTIRKIVHTEISGNTYAIRTLSRPYRFRGNKSQDLNAGTNSPINKKPGLSLTHLQPSTSDTVDIALDTVPYCLDGANSPTRYGKKVRIPLRAEGTLSDIVMDGQMVAPFTVYSSSANNTSLEILSNKEITNLHQGGYVFKDKPLQGPFTEKYVGGAPWRSVGIPSGTMREGQAALTAGENAANADYTTQFHATDNRSNTGCSNGTLEPIYVTSNALGGTLSNIANGDMNHRASFNNLTLGGATTYYVQFKLNASSAAPCNNPVVDEPLVITEAKWYFYTSSWSSDLGTWQYQGSSNGSDWTDIGSSFTLADSSGLAPYPSIWAFETHTELSGNTTAYAYYRIKGESGTTTTSGISVGNVEFKIAFARAGTPDYVVFEENTQEDKRLEGFRLLISDNTASIMQPEKNSAGTIDMNLPTGRYYRDEVAKRPLNIRNIKQTTGSTVIGNYDHVIQYTQLSNRRLNNSWWVQSGSDSPLAPILFDEDSFSHNDTTNAWPYIHGTASDPGGYPLSGSKRFVGMVDSARPNRGKNKHVIVERFSAPGDVLTMGDANGGPGLDVLSAEYSLYNNINLRNMWVRGPLNQWLSESSGLHGYRVGHYPAVSGGVEQSASYHKTQRNSSKRYRYNHGEAYEDNLWPEGVNIKALRDSWFFQRAIPSTDAGYAWITASATDIPFEYATDARLSASTHAGRFITYVSHSDAHGAALGYATPGGHYVIKNSGVKVDFVGLNTLIYDPLVSGSNILSSSDTFSTELFNTDVHREYRNIDFAKLAFSGALHALLLHRNGPYGYPIFKQIRTGEHPVARNQRQINEINYIERSNAERTVPIPGHRTPHVVSVAEQDRVRRVTEPALTSRYKPMLHKLRANTGIEGTDHTLYIKHSYGNNINYYANIELDDNIELANGQPLVNEEPQPYDQIIGLYQDGAWNRPDSPVNDIFSLRYSETVYPREKYAFLNQTRDRVYYNVIDEVRWRNARKARLVSGSSVSGSSQAVTNSSGFSGSSDSGDNDFYFSSIWPLDSSRLLNIAQDGVPAAPFTGSLVDASLYTADQIDTVRVGTGTETRYNETVLSLSIHGGTNQQNPQNGYSGMDGAGELMNDYVTWHNGITDRVVGGAVYARRTPEFMVVLSGSPHVQAIAGGLTKWEAGDQSGKRPFYDDYDEFVDNIKRSGKDHTVVPEFRISDFMERYVDTHGGNFLADIDDMLAVDGAAISNSSQDNFYSTYSHTDFMKHFDVVVSDHRETTIGPNFLTPKKIKLKCSAYMKFRPRDGFYPAQRTLQLATLFSKSFGPSTVLEGADANFRTAMQPFFGPGILFNAIKSGIAVDFPVMAGGLGRTGSYTVLKMNRSYPPSYYNNYPSGSPGYLLNQQPYHLTNWANSDFAYMKLTDDFSLRVPFDGLVNPQAYLAEASLHDIEVNMSASLSSTASLGAPVSPTYQMAMHNFLAEVPSFFLQGENFSSFVSDPENEFASTEEVDGQVKKYVMDVTLQDTLVFRSGSNGLTAYGYPANEHTASVIMYERESAFGPPVEAAQRALQSDGNPADFSYISQAPFTPPYRDGPAKIRYTFSPGDAKQYTLAEIFAQLTASCVRDGVVRAESTTAGAFTTMPYAYRNMMHITASIDTQGIILDRKVSYDENGNVLSVREEVGAPARWVISPKFETPILNFKDVDISLPVSGSGSAARGMWHQYGTLPKQDEGIFLSIRDMQDADKKNTSTTGTSAESHHPETTGSLADLVGLPKRDVKLGQPAQTKKVREAVVAIPFTVRNGRKRFFEISREQIRAAKLIANSPDSDPRNLVRPENMPGKSVVEMVEKMQRYVLPPKFDFLTYEDRDAFAMYIFEFTHVFSQLDLTDMWQNLSPDLGREFKHKEVTVEHSIAENEFFGEYLAQGTFPEELRWMVFKVKQRAEKSYFAKTLGAADDARFQFQFMQEDPLRRTQTISKAPAFSYNWPYDYFSMVELVKMDSEVTIAKERMRANLDAPEAEDAEMSSEEIRNRNNANTGQDSNVSNQNLEMQRRPGYGEEGL